MGAGLPWLVGFVKKGRFGWTWVVEWVGMSCVGQSEGAWLGSSVLEGVGSEGRMGLARFGRVCRMGWVGKVRIVERDRSVMGRRDRCGRARLVGLVRSGLSK